MGQTQINVRTRACSRTFIARTKQAALTHNVRGKELRKILATTIFKCKCEKFLMSVKAMCLRIKLRRTEHSSGWKRNYITRIPSTVFLMMENTNENKFT